MKRLSLIIGLILLIPALLLLWISTTESGLHWTYSQAQNWLPAELEINRISGRLLGPIYIERATYTSDDLAVEAGDIELDWQAMELLAARFDINRLYMQSLQIKLPDTASDSEHTGSPPTRAITLPDITLPLQLAVSDARISNIQIQHQNQQYLVQQLTVDASMLLSKLDIYKLAITADTWEVDISGHTRLSKRYGHGLSINWSATLPSSEKLSGKGKLTGNIKKTRFSQKTQGALNTELEAELQDLTGKLQWRADLNASRYELQRISADLPAFNGAFELNSSGNLTTARIEGKLDADSADTGALDANFDIAIEDDTNINIRQLVINAPATSSRVVASGHWNPANTGDEADLDIEWNNLRWPLIGEPVFNSKTGSGVITGNLQKYQLTIDSDSPWAELLPSSWHAVASGDLNGIEIEALRINALDGEIVSRGHVDWSPTLGWQAQARARNINPAALWPQWPGQLNAQLHSDGKLENGQITALLDIKQMEGQLRDYPLHLVSELHWQDNGLNISSFDLKSAESRVTATGRIADTLKLEWTIDSDNLAQLYPQADGQLKARGSLVGPQQQPFVKIEAQGKSLGYSDYQIESIAGTASIDLLNWQQIDIDVIAQALQLKDTRLKSIRVNSHADLIKFDTVGDAFSATLTLKGRAVKSGWGGHIEGVDIRSTTFQDWRLASAAAISLGTNELNVQPFCLLSGDSRLCIDMNATTEKWHANLDAEHVPLLMLSPWLPQDLVLEGTTSARARFNFNAPDTLLGHATLDLPAGILSYPVLEGERDRWEYSGGRIAITINESGIYANSEFAISADDHLRFSAELPGARLLALDADKQKLRADALLTISDLGLLEALIPDIQDLIGTFSVQLAATGTLAQPRINGTASLEQASLRIPRLGLNIERVSMKSRSRGLEKLDFRLDAASGDGTLVVEGLTLLDQASGWPTEISIKGKDFEVSRIPEARVLASPDIKINIKNRSVDVSGEVHIPYAKLQPRDITTAARVSNDAVIIGQEHTLEDKWLINSQVRVILGERVSFYGYGFEGRFEGNLLIEDEPGQLTRATGEIRAPEGRYRAYGQRLDVEHGRVLYTGGPLTNPGLDIQAVRRVENVTAGIRVKGSLNNPHIELFSIPAMGQTDALAYLILGAPIEGATGEQGEMMAKAALALGLSGGDRIARSLGDRFGLDEMRVETSDTGEQASLVVGRYLSSRLYVSYGVGLVEAFNTLTLRYKISNKWQLKAESGEHHGADFLYTIER